MHCLSYGVQVFYEDIGTGLPVVMLHGFSLDHQMMKGCMEPVFTNLHGFRRLYVDLPGMGLTTLYHHIANSDEMLEVILDFIDQVLPEKPFLIAGESYGGYLARGVIEKRRSQVKGALFLCPMVVPEKEKRDLPPRTLLMEDKHLWDKLTLQEQEDFTAMAVVANEYTWSRYKNEILAGCELADYPFLEKIKTAYGFSFELDTVCFPYPSLFVVGRQDSSVGFKDAWHLIDNYPRSSFVVLDCAGHNLQIEQPHLFTELVHDWLGRVSDYLNEPARP